MKNLIVFLLVSFSVQGLVAQAPIGADFFKEVDAFMKTYVEGNGVDYAAVKQNPSTLNALVDQVANATVSGADAATTQAFYINAYNLLVINGVVQNYPLNSVLDVTGFFDGKKHTVAGKSMTLNQLEKEQLLKTYKDARFHFVLVCGAVDCPPIASFAYTPEKLEEQLDQRTRRALNDPGFIQIDMGSNKASLSQIFEWYASDFGGSKKAVRAYINQYRAVPISANYTTDFYNYNWSLNDKNTGTSEVEVPTTGGNSSARYVVSSAIRKGTTESKLFNNLYTQQSGNGESLTDRSTFFTSWLSFLYGVNNRFNAGFDLRYRRVLNDQLPSSPFAVLGSGEGGTFRNGITTVGPKIRWAAFEKLPNFSIQSAFWFPIGDELEGDGTRPYIDWNSSTWWTQFFNDFTLNDNFSVFTEIDFLWEDIGNPDNGAFNRVSTPATVILSYFPNPKTTVYALSGFSPFWQQEFDYFAQAGVGAKYQFTPNFEIELLYTAFTNKILQEVNGRAATYNIGVRYNR
ncbi:MAG: DUF547 domain-containing protein [Bacteroidota bacterium]